MLVPCGAPSFLARPHAWKYKYGKLHISLYVHLVELFDIGALNKQAYWCSKQAADIIPPPPFFFLFGIQNDKNRMAARDPHTKSHDKPWRRLLLIQSGVSASLQSVKMCTKLQLWSDPFTISEIPPSQNASRSSPWVIFSIATSSSLDFFFFFLFTPEAHVAYAEAPSCRSPVWCVPQLRPCVGDLQSVFHPEALFVRSLESGEVTQQSDRFHRTVCQDDLIGRIDLWLWKTERESGPLTEAGLKVS